MTDIQTYRHGIRTSLVLIPRTTLTYTVILKSMNIQSSVSSRGPKSGGIKKRVEMEGARETTGVTMGDDDDNRG